MPRSGSSTALRTTALREQARRTIQRAVNGGADDVVLFCGSGATDAIDRLVRILERGAFGSFSAASNVTGILTDTEAVAALLHEHGALSLWDYAAAGPHVRIDVNPAPGAEKDAIFVSPHKFPGGPGTPGVLVAKRRLFANRVPAVPGGGTISFVGPERHTYRDDPVLREEGGTPAIVESIRAGLVFALEERVGADAIRAREGRLVRRALASWAANPRILVLGNPGLERVPIVTFGIRHELPDRSGGMLHGSFVAAVLDDLFGIQARSGCFCAGPYTHRLVPIDDETSAGMERETVGGCEGVKLAFVRLSFDYFIGETVFDHLVQAVHFVADEGRRFLPLYRFDPATGLWRHRDARPEPAPSLDPLARRSPTRPPASRAGRRRRRPRGCPRTR